MGPLESLGSALEGLTSAIQNKFNQTLNYIYDLINTVGSIIDYINPASDSFFLKVAFVPSDEFIENELYSLKDEFFSKFDFIFQVRDGISAFATGVESIEQNDFGITADMDLGFIDVGEVTLVDGWALQEYGAKLRFWMGSLIYLLTGAYLIRQLNNMLR